MVTIERLRETEIFHSLSDEELEMVSPVCQSRVYDNGAIIVREGEESTEIYVVDDGAVNCEIEPLPNQRVAVCTVTKNCVFGWSALLSPHRYTATVVGDTAIAACGLNEKQAMEAGFDIVTGEASAVDKHPGAMPHARELRVRLVFDRKSGKILGGNACCVMSVGEIANLMALAIVSGMRVEQMATFPMGTHPALTASPLAYQITDAACQALRKLTA